MVLPGLGERYQWPCKPAARNAGALRSAAASGRALYSEDILSTKHDSRQVIDSQAVLKCQFLHGPLEMDATRAHFRGESHFHAVYCVYELRLLSAMKQLGTDAQLPGRGLRAATHNTCLSGLGLEILLVFTPFVRRPPTLLAVITEETYAYL